MSLVRGQKMFLSPARLIHLDISEGYQNTNAFSLAALIQLGIIRMQYFCHSRDLFVLALVKNTYFKCKIFCHPQDSFLSTSVKNTKIRMQFFLARLVLLDISEDYKCKFFLSLARLVRLGSSEEYKNTKAKFFVTCKTTSSQHQ